MTTSEASGLLEQVARDRGLTVRRLDPETVVCSDGSKRVLFHGLCGARSAKVAHELCSNIAWLRTHLAAHDIPVVDWRLVDIDDLDAAQESAAEVGFPVTLRVSDGTRSWDAAARSPAEFREQWRRLARPPGNAGTSWASVERAHASVHAEMAIVGGVVTAGACDEQTGQEARQLATRALDAVPGLHYAAVRLVQTAQPLVEWLGPLPAYCVAGECGRQIVEAIVEFECGSVTAHQDRHARGDRHGRTAGESSYEALPDID